MSTVPAAAAPADRTVARMRHDLRLRLLDIVGLASVTPRLVRVTFGGEHLTDFCSPGFDDHVKVFVPPKGEAFDSLPPLGPEGPMFKAGAPSPARRDYTPHHHDPAALTMQVDFVLHGEGPAAAWARRARAGDKVIVGGPRSSFLVGVGFDWHLLMGDDTALPAIRRRLAELPAGSRAVVFAEVERPGDAEPFASDATVETYWVYRSRGDGGSACLLDALAGVRLPEGDYYAWIACESSDAKAIRKALLERGADRRSLKAAGYWRRGSAAIHDVHE